MRDWDRPCWCAHSRFAHSPLWGGCEVCGCDDYWTDEWSPDARQGRTTEG